MVTTPALLLPDEALARVLTGRVFDQLVTLGRVAQRGAFVFALYTSALPCAAFTCELRRRLEPLPVFDSHLSADHPQPCDYLQALTPAQQQQRAWINLFDLEAGFPESARWLDLQRESLAAHPHVLLIWLKAANCAEIARLAPNVFSRHSGVFNLSC